MAVSNIKSIGGRKPIPSFYPIPPAFGQIYKLEVITSTETLDVTNLVMDGEITDGVTGTIGEFDIIIDNSTNEFSNVGLWDKIKFYTNYGSEATNHTFTGFIERPSKKDNKIEITGRGTAALTTGVNVIYTATNKARSEVLIEIIEKYFSGEITTTNIETDSTLINVNYFEVPFWEIVEELTVDAGYDVYIDKDFDFHYFEEGSRQNNTEAISETVNLLETGDFSPDLEQTYNKVRVYGKEIDGVPIISTNEDISLQNLYGIKTLKINDSNILNNEQASERSLFELNKNKLPPTIGMITSLMLPSLQPGEKLFIANPQNDIIPGYYKTYKFMHRFGSEIVPSTEVTIKKEKLNVPNIMKKRISFESRIASNPNPNEMDSSYRITFTEDSGTHLNTITNEGFLKVKTGESSGQWISDVITLSKDIARIEFYMTGELLIQQYQVSTSYLWYSLDGGTVWKLSPGNGIEITGLSGNQLRFRVDLNSTTAKVKSVQTLFSENN